MAKTSPIGVRFDGEILIALKDNGIEVTPQKALSMYEAVFKNQLDYQIAILSGKTLLHIYKLVNPLNNQVFYIGRTSANLSTRLGAHIAQVNSKTTTEHLNKRKIGVLKEILDSGQKPQIELIETVLPISEDELRGYHKREIYWMIHYLNLNQPITNRISPMMIANFKTPHKEPQTTPPVEAATNNSEIDKQIAAVKAATMPNGMAKRVWDFDQRKKITQLERLKTTQNEISIP